MTAARLIPIKQIEISADRIRAIEEDDPWIEVLASSIEDQGLLHPISVIETEIGYRLVAGGHRLAAFRLLGHSEIPAQILQLDDARARLAEVTENIARNPLTALERAHSLFEIDHLYKSIYPELKNGGDRGNQHTGGKIRQSPIVGLRQEILSEVGLGRASFFKNIAIWRGLSPASRSRLKGTWLADHQAGLQHLSELKATDQKKVLDILFPDDGRPLATNVPDAITLLKKGQLPGHLEKKYQSLNRQISQLDDVGLDAIFASHKTRLINWLRASGDID